jgi:hypothetical protein
MTSYVVDVNKVEIGVEEPITVQQAKDYIRVTDNFQDNIIAILITAARQSIEKLTGLSIKMSNITCIINNPDGEIELPYQPLYGVITSSNYSNIETTGLLYKNLITQGENINLAYQAGFSDIPTDLLIAIYDQFAFLYDNRGETTETGQVSEKAYRTCLRYTRQPIFS